MSAFCTRLLAVFSKFPPRFRHRTPISTISQLQKVAQDIEFNGEKWWVVQGSNL
jgi:hypothetical protein